MTAHPSDLLRYRAPRRRAFTLAEMLVIIGIILVVMIIALPAFTAIVGSRSIEAGQNIVAASIVRARAEAIRRGQPCGVFFYVDVDTGRTGAAMVVLDDLGDPDPYDQYKPFFARRGGAGPTRDYQGGTHDPLPDVEDEPAMTADRVLVLGSDVNSLTYRSDGRYANFAGRPIILTMKHSSQDINGNPNPGLTPPGDTDGVPRPVIGNTGNPVDSRNRQTARNTTSNEYWNLDGVDVGYLELIEGLEPRLLPAGTGLQLVLGASLDADPGLQGAMDTSTTPATFRERYARYGLILFDNQGRLLQSEYAISRGSRLGRLIGLDALNVDLPPTPADLYPRSQLGVVIYSNDAFATASGDGTARDWTGDRVTSLTGPVIENFATSNADREFPWRHFNALTGATLPTPQDEYAEERWLDFNTIPLMVNRYSGMLVEAE